ncbi:MAG: cation diffusion facilitator family transporter [Planctomycetota bacterium]|jgi:ferrous-iron efflux pump FieF|nr:cation diffusion facilitator family transporter [Planctomycetota bacterium]
MELPTSDLHGKRRSSTAKTSVKVAVGLLVMKGTTFLVTSSTGVLGSALDSLFDMLASLLVLWAILAAERPANAKYQWGHGKAEGLAALFQSLFILVSGLGLLVHTVNRFSKQEEYALTMPWLGVGVMVVSSTVTLWLVGRLRKVALETGSPALQADSHHYTSDLLMNLSVVVGLVLAWLLDGALWPDLVVGVGISLLIMNTAREVFVQSIEGLMDRGLRPRESAAIMRAVSDFTPKVSGFHDLRSRRSGADIFLELHLDLDRQMSFVEAHDLSEDVGLAIESALPNSTVTIHADPL